MFETSDVHPEIISQMKLFHRVIVPFQYLKEILDRHGVNCVSIDFFTSQLIRDTPPIIPKTLNPTKQIFLYVGTNDVRKNVQKLTRVFADVAMGTDHLLIVKTNSEEGLTRTKNIRIVTEKIQLNQLASLYNMCDYVISFTRGEGVGMPMVEGAYFGKPVIAHDQGVFRDVKKFIQTEWITLAADEVKVDYRDVPPFLQHVFHGTWWEVKEDQARATLRALLASDKPPDGLKDIEPSVDGV